jgi:hypothetical protein
LAFAVLYDWGWRLASEYLKPDTNMGISVHSFRLRLGFHGVEDLYQEYINESLHVKTMILDISGEFNVSGFAFLSK